MELSVSAKEKLRKAGVSKRHIGFVPMDSKSEQWTAEYSKCKERVDDGGIIGILGSRGCGKTQMGSSAIGHILFNGEKSAMYTKAFDVFLSIRNGNSKNSMTTEKEEVEKFIEPHLLVIDAFEVRGDTEFENRSLNHIIDRRYDECRPTIIISNDSVDTFISSVGASILDRMKQGGGIISLTESSFRGK